MERRTYTEDEHEVDFNDTSEFAAKRWRDATIAIKSNIVSGADYEKASLPRDWQTLHTYIQDQSMDTKAAPGTRRLLNHLLPFPRTMNTLLGIFTRSIKPYEADFRILWGLLELNIKLSLVSNPKLNRTVSWMKRLRSVLELFNRCLDVCEDMNEARLAMADVLEYLLQLFGESSRHLRQCPTDAEAARAAKDLDIRVNENLSDMDDTVKHLNDITSYSKANAQRQVQNLANRHAPHVIPEEYATFPIRMIPRERNEDFYGRREELDRINNYLDYSSNNPPLRTYTIYGRRGVGKTNIALEYAYKNPANFDAIFWVQCETSLSLRQSFTDMAVNLNLPGADRNGHDEENQLAVLKWLKITKKKWLLIFDNAERESILRGYWPLGANGAILITSRKYYNFMNDASRKGDTVKPFNDRQSWDLLMKLLGPEWEDLDRRGLIQGTEESAAKELLKNLGGLALAIQQAAQLIKKPNIAGTTIAGCLETFREIKRSLPPRQTADRSDIIHSLDSLWDMTFKHLSRNARDMLSVLSLFSPDRILIDLFLPKNQRALDGKLNFCKQHPNLVDEKAHALSSVITIPPLLRNAIDELVDFKLITEEGRELRAHRVVQEAMNYLSYKDLQGYFDSASSLVYEAFPKQVAGDYLSTQWSACQTYISHGAHLSLQFSTYRRASSKLKGSKWFIKLLANCAWYLYETSNYDICLRMVETGQLACGDDTETMQYAVFCNIAGLTYYELNKLGDCRKNLEVFYHLQEKHLGRDDLERSISLHNMGLLEASSDNPIDSMDYFTKAIDIRLKAGDAASNLLANSYLCKSRVHFNRKEYDEAFSLLAKSEALYFRTAGDNAHFMAHVHYAYGNIEFDQKRWASAKRSYEQCLKVSLLNSPIHPLTASAYYSLGCVEFEQGNADNAKGQLEKAMAIATLRSPHRDDGYIARILWKLSKVLESDVVGTYHQQANDMRIRAEVARRVLAGNGEGGVVIALDENGDPDKQEDEDSYDALIPGYFR